MWQPVPGGYLAFWDGPAFVAERGDTLALAWSAPGDDWFSDRVIIDGAVILGGARAAAAIVRLALSDGHEQWRVPLVPGSQDITVDTDGQLVYATWSEPAPGAPTPTVAIPRRIRALELATGRTLWSHDFAAAPGALAAGRGTIVAAIDGDLRFIDGATGRLLAQVRLGSSSIYPGLLVDRDRVFAALGDSVTAFTLATGKLLWRASVKLDGGPRLALAGADLVVSTAAGILVAVDRAMGERRWEIGLGLRPDAIIATPAALVALAAGHAAGVGLPLSIPVESARLRGRVVPGDCGPVADAIVMVGATRVPLDASGHYDASIVARGIVTVAVTTAQPSSLSGASVATVHLDGRGDYRVPDLTPGRCDRE